MINNKKLYFTDLLHMSSLNQNHPFDISFCSVISSFKENTRRAQCYWICNEDWSLLIRCFFFSEGGEHLTFCNKGGKAQVNNISTGNVSYSNSTHHSSCSSFKLVFSCDNSNKQQYSHKTSSNDESETEEKKNKWLFIVNSSSPLWINIKEKWRPAT